MQDNNSYINEIKNVMLKQLESSHFYCKYVHHCICVIFAATILHNYRHNIFKLTLL